MKTKHILSFGICAAMLAVAFAACENPSGGGGGGGGEQPDPAHTHNWGAWAATDITGTEERVCKSSSSHIEHRLTGTGRFTFELISGAAAYRVSKGTATVGTVRIPAYYRPSAESEYQPVTAIGSTNNNSNDEAFSYCTSLTSIIIPESITSIGNLAFRGCTSLTSVTIPTSVTTIGSGAFRECTSLTSIAIPAGVTTIGGSAFSGCTSLTSIAIPASVTSIGNDAFNNCTSLEVVTFAAGSQLTSIGSYAFYNCSLTSIAIPAGVMSIGEGAFTRCTSLTAITVAASNPNYVGDGGILYNKAKTILIQAPPAGINGTVTIPVGVTSIGNNAFYYCTSLTSITIPPGVTSIGDRAFSSCDYLASITIPPGVTSIGDGAFSNCYLASITIPSSVTRIGNVSSIGPDYFNGAFYSCGNLATVTFATDSELTTIGHGTFSSCTKLTSITIPVSVTTIGDSAFYYCRSLTSITIPSSVTSVGQNAFRDWTSSQTIYVEGHADANSAATAWGSGWRQEQYYSSGGSYSWRPISAQIIYQGL
jgi:hypothetical protein